MTTIEALQAGRVLVTLSEKPVLYGALPKPIDEQAERLLCQAKEHICERRLCSPRDLPLETRLAIYDEAIRASKEEP